MTRRWACDTSVAVAALDPNHEAHSVCRGAVVERSPVLAGHAALETYAVLTRLPPPLRVEPATAGPVIGEVFGEPCWPDEGVGGLVERLSRAGVIGGATYDAIVGLAARDEDRVLLTRDRRALRTYQQLGVAFELL